MSQEAKWMVRSGGRVIGPFEKGQIGGLLKTREIQLRDEISAPLSRWFAIERHPEFIEEADQFKRDLHSEKTEVSLTPADVGLTQTFTDVGDSELTEEITNDLSGFTRTKEIVVENVQDVPGSAKANLESAQYQLKGLDSSPYVRGKSRKASLIIQAVVVVCAVAVAGFLYMRFQSQRPVVDKLSTVQLKSVVQKLIERGDYAEALSVMKSRQNESGFLPNLGIYFSLLSLQVENQSLVARRVLNQLLEEQPDLRVRTYTGLGLSYLVDQNFIESVQYFRRALELDSSFVPARVDDLIALYLAGSPLDDQDLSSANWVKSESEALLTWALSVIKGSKTNYYRAAVQSLETLADTHFDHRLEMRFLALYLRWRMNPTSVDFSEWEVLVDMDPTLTEMHRYNVFIYRNHLAWSQLLPFCQQMVSGKEAHIEAELMNVFCLFQARKYQEARMKAEAVVDRHPKNSLSQGWYAMALRESGSADQASVVLGRALEANRKVNARLPILLQGRFCEATKNLNCAYESWKRLLEVDYNNLAAIAGMARAIAQQGSNAEAEKYLKRGMALSPDYKPLLALKDEWRSQL